jgi:ATP-dependent helicase STH1/SNF2
MLRRVKSSVMGQLPDKVEKVLRCQLSGWQKHLYKQIQTEGALAINPKQQSNDGSGGGSSSTSGNINVGKGLSNIFMQLRKVSNALLCSSSSCCSRSQ